MRGIRDGHTFVLIGIIIAAQSRFSEMRLYKDSNRYTPFSGGAYGPVQPCTSSHPLNCCYSDLEVFSNFVRDLQRRKHLETYRFLSDYPHLFIPLAPRFIQNTDGIDKQDYETTAGKRIIIKT